MPESFVALALLVCLLLICAAGWWLEHRRADTAELRLENVLDAYETQLRHDVLLKNSAPGQRACPPGSLEATGVDDAPGSGAEPELVRVPNLWRLFVIHGDKP